MGNCNNNGWPATFGDGVVCHNQKELDQYLIGTNHAPIEPDSKLGMEISFAVGALPRDQLEDAAADLDLNFDKWTSSDEIRASVIEAAHKNGGLLIYKDDGVPTMMGFGGPPKLDVPAVAAANPERPRG